ncbi:MAG: tRNA pseudouridine(38-40) synthase TruA [Syntrophaceae bacterium]|nr:tRNA pseudouridine(38-40) synthase TruA [Syntrophaceae bacterium]
MRRPSPSRRKKLPVPSPSRADDPGIIKYRLVIEYDGTGYRGWQIQENARTVQGTLIAAARELFGGPVEIQGSGRTDAGVHALGQAAHLVVPRKISPDRLRQGLNDLLPSGICVLRAEEADPRFHARRDAVSRSYLYVLSRERTAFGKRYVWWVRDRLDTRAMQSAAQVFEGFHDFSSFADRRMDGKTSSRVKVESVELWEQGDLILFRVRGSHFLWKMVRRMVGTLVEVGRGNLSEADLGRMLEERSDLPARLTAPPSGLFLEEVLYEGERAVREGEPSPLLPVTLKTLSRGTQSRSRRAPGKAR